MTRCANCGHENRSGARFCEACGAALQERAPATEQRKTVTVFFSDVTGSTALGERLDPESLRGVMARYFDLARRVVEKHGGSVEKFIGDAVMAVFGIPVLHEDDALRAVRAASELRDAMTGLNESLAREYGTTLELRIGVNTGEVVTGTEERLATGDAVNVTARLEQAAQPGEILLGAETRALVRGAVVAEATEPLELKGKAAPVVAFRLLSLAAAVPPRDQLGVMVGRGRELDRLRAALNQAIADSSCQLFTVLGAAGVGKSRLVHEFLDGLDDVAITRGACLSYGDGITYWPVVDVLKQILGGDPEARLAELGLDPFATRAVHALLGDGSVAATVEEIAWGLRQLLEAVAADRPLVVVLDDIHWGEAAFLDLVDHIADLSRNAPMLLLCMARPELLDRRPGWGGGKLNATTVLLEPLGSADTEQLVANLLAGATADRASADEALRTRILTAAEGNPFFVEEMIALLRDSPGGEVAVPPTIQALLAARLDQLDPAERVVLERGSVEGRVFHRGAVQALSPAAAQLVAPITALIRRELLRPDQSQLPGEDAFRFRHLLIRDAAYDALPKAVRADLHERFATWIQTRGTDLTELDEIVGYHLERAYRYRAELGRAGDAERDLAARAAERLGTAGNRASTRGDMRAATNLLGRGVELYPTDDRRRLSLLPVLGAALHEAGEWDRAEAFLTEAMELGRAADDRRTVAHASVALTNLRLYRGSFDSHDSIRAALADAVVVFEELGDRGGLGRALGIAGQLKFWAGRSADALGDLELAAEHARSAGDRLQEVSSLAYGLLATTIGPMPAPAALELIEQIRGRADGHPRLEIAILRCQAFLRAIQGGFEPARALIADALALSDAMGLKVAAAGVRLEAGRVELLDGQADAAVRVIRPGLEALEAMGDRGHFVTVAPILADALLAKGDDEEAERLLELTAAWALDDDIDPQISRRRVQAKLHARRGELDEAERLAQEAVELAGRTDYSIDHARALEDLAEVLRFAGRPEEGATELRRALGLYEAKGDLVSAANMRALLERPRPAPADSDEIRAESPA